MTARFTARSWALLSSVAVVVLAVLALLITGNPDADPAAASTDEPSTPMVVTPDPEPERVERPDDGSEKKTKKKDRPEPRHEKPVTPTAYVEVFNNSGITGLAGSAADELSGAGWRVLGTDNWYGEIPATTVYFPPRLRGQAALLADEVGATRTRPAVEPMRFDRLTLILTGDL